MHSAESAWLFMIQSQHMKKIILGAGIISSAVMMLGAVPAIAQTVSTTADATATTTSTTISTSMQDQIQALLAEISTLKAQIALLIQNNATLQNNVQQIQQTLQITTSLHQGMSSDDVKKLQSVLATDPTLFSKDNVTGFFGPLTAEAVANFQKHFGIDAVGVVGPRTMEKINELLKESGVKSEQDLSDHELGNLDDNKSETEQGGSNASSMQSEGEGDAISNEHSNGASSLKENNATSSSENRGKSGNDN